MFGMPGTSAAARVATNLSSVLALAAVVVMAGATEASAARKKVVAHPAPVKKEAAKKEPPANAKPTLVATFGDWGTYEAQGPKSKICYALAQPKQRTPATLKRDAAYIFISSRPGEGIHNEVSVMMGVPLKDGATDAKAEVGSAAFDLVTKGQNAWMRNAAQESQLIDAMKKHGRLVVKAPVAKGSVADSYSLAGLGQALDRVSKDCP